MSSEIVALVFRFLNFGVAAGVGTYVFKKNILPDIKAKIAERRELVRAMEMRNQELLEQKNTVVREISEQEALGKRLYDQIKVWSFSYQKETALLEQERKIVRQEIERRAQLQAEIEAQAEINKQALTIALQGAEQELSRLFAEPQEGKIFIASVVEHMRKEMRS